MPWELEGLATALFMCPGGKMSVCTRSPQNKFELLLYVFHFPFFSFVEVTYVPSHGSQVPCKASLVIINCY